MKETVELSKMVLNSGTTGPQGQQGPAGGDDADTWASNNTTTGGDVINERDGFIN